MLQTLFLEYPRVHILFTVLVAYLFQCSFCYNVLFPYYPGLRKLQLKKVRLKAIDNNFRFVLWNEQKG